MSWRTAIVKTVLFSAVNLIALVRWGDSAPWSRVDRFSVAALVLMVVQGAMTQRMAIALGPDVSHRFFVEHLNPKLWYRRKMLRALEILALLDYSHGPLVPALMLPALQTAALVVAVGAMLWVWRVDSYLIVRFPSAVNGEMLQDGPFRRIRHPRYSGLLAGRLAEAALLGSIFGWLQFAAVAFFFTRRMLREEQHLLTVFPGAYRAYVHRTGRVLPRLRSNQAD